ncbi:hypothetical protein CERSUDRAFT_110022 [Gelatoporia subvermispora B]|uniref:Methyltransferase domain-containing protein n=1 Tax=Ceriporiopsis subvermispora (strain B) TaxID=914234 RepID=M2RAL6_CERS8|nr:hypothetical protein CERSUDRAFT_110022 [Gelatoporia subvermispora B]
MSHNVLGSTDAAGDVDAKIVFDPKDYDPDQEELAFLKSQTGITDEEALKQHCFKVQADAHKIFPYNCIRRFNFLRLKIARLPAYPHLLKIGKERQGAIFLDIGCCFGNDARKAIADGYPAENVITSDLRPEFWQLGHELFKSTPETFPVPFVPGDAFNQDFLKRISPFYEPPSTPVPDLRALTSFTPLLGHVSAIHASSFFHLFDEEGQFLLAQSLAGLLSPEPGSIIFGMHGGAKEKGLNTEGGLRRGSYMFCHSPESWTELWDGQVFKKGTVKVEAELGPSSRSRHTRASNHLRWCIIRL